MYYTVQPGDTLSAIAKKFNTSVSALAKLNGISNPDFIQVGQILKTHGNSTATYNSTYIVQPDDTLSAIAKKFNTTVAHLTQINGISNPDFIQVGQILKISGSSNISGSNNTSSPSTYIVQPGDTLSAIAKKFNTTVAHLAQINGITNPDFIQVGQILKIKGSAPSHNKPKEPKPQPNLPTTCGKYVTGKQLAAIGWTNIDQNMVNDLNSCLERFHITTRMRICHFIAQCSHESGLGIYKTETDPGYKYNGRRDLGNIYPGDGPKFRGAGYIQITGRANYQRFANYIKDDNIMKLGCSYVAEKYP